MASIAALIEAWFADHQDDDEFAYSGDFACSTCSSGVSFDAFVYATKPELVLNGINTPTYSPRVGIIAPSRGLPPARACEWLCETVKKKKLLFLGDMDPVDLLVFGWLRAQLHTSRVVYLGISDGYLRVLNVSVPESHWIQCSLSEREAIARFESFLPDFRKIVGPESSRLLESGLKIELEAVVSVLGSPAELLRPALGAADA